MQKTAIIGSRHFYDYKSLCDLCDKYNIAFINSGGAIGVDTLAERYAIERNIPIQIFFPDWNQFGKRAGFLRNIEIIDNSDLVIAFWDGQSRGTKHSIDYAVKQGKEVIIEFFNS